MTKQITLTPEQARDMLGKDAAMDQLIRANFTDEELNPKPKYPKRWEDLERVEGFFSTGNSVVIPITYDADESARNIFTTEQQARSFGIAAAQLSQLMKVYRGEWVPDWNNTDQRKYCIDTVSDGGFQVNDYGFRKHFLSFPNSNIAYQFLTDHRELITEFYKGM